MKIIIGFRNESTLIEPDFIYYILKKDEPNIKQIYNNMCYKYPDYYIAIKDVKAFNVKKLDNPNCRIYYVMFRKYDNTLYVSGFELMTTLVLDEKYLYKTIIFPEDFRSIDDEKLKKALKYTTRDLKEGYIIIPNTEEFSNVRKRYKYENEILNTYLQEDIKNRRSIYIENKIIK